MCQLMRTIPETILKQRKQLENQRKERLIAASEKKKDQKKKRQVMFKRAEQYLMEYQQQEKQVVRERRIAKRDGNYFVEAEPKVVLVIRLKGINKIPPKPRKIMQLFRLYQINNAVLLRMSKATKNMLKIIEPYCAWGTPNLKTVKHLVYKRGFAKINTAKTGSTLQRIPLHSNSLIEEHLGKFDLICIEDLIHELITVGPNFKSANSFLWPFKLSHPTGGFRPRKFKGFVEGGEVGDREDLINELAQRMI
eukprot:NODE_604_length_6199_cov_0.403115.p3 type:complete len:251 gc:universal NODE_604_length_6199_cov_0.403115:2432-1680(-)